MSYIGNQVTSVAHILDTFSGNSSTTQFALTRTPASTSSIEVFINGLYQQPTANYTLSGSTLTFTTAPSTGTNNINVLHIGLGYSATQIPADSTVTTNKIVNYGVTSVKMSNTGVTSATYGGGSSSSVVVPVIEVDAAGRLTSAANATLSLNTFDTISIANVTVSETTTLAQVIERANTSSVALSGTTLSRTSIYANNGTVLYYTAEATDNYSFDFLYDGNTSLDSFVPYGKAITFVIFATNGATAKYCEQVRIDGNIVTPKWQGGSAPSAGNSNSVDAYSFTLFHTALNTWTVFASQTRFA